jgi:PTH1 family peptidyl-tRNA hydrolase
VKIVVGLGNPGRRYAKSRHNLGFRIVSAFAARRSFSFSKKKYRSLIASGTFAGEKIVLVKPQAFMNLSGEAVGSLVRFYNLRLSDLLVVYDDIDIPFGNIRLRPAGGSGGHKGMESIVANLGDEAFPRLRIGILGGLPPGDLSGYVLKNFTAEEQDALEGIIQRACDAVEAALSGPFEEAMNRFN